MNLIDGVPAKLMIVTSLEAPFLSRLYMSGKLVEEREFETKDAAEAHHKYCAPDIHHANEKIVVLPENAVLVPGTETVH